MTFGVTFQKKCLTLFRESWNCWLLLFLFSACICTTDLCTGIGLDASDNPPPPPTTRATTTTTPQPFRHTSTTNRRGEHLFAFVYITKNLKLVKTAYLSSRLSTVFLSFLHVNHIVGLQYYRYVKCVILVRFQKFHHKKVFPENTKFLQNGGPHFLGFWE